ncbi:MAG: tetratricopeptide repeat protein [Beijerinckiaceae bacterium]
MQRITRISLALAAAMAAAGCSEFGLDPSAPAPAAATTPVSPLETKFYSSDEDVQAGFRNFEEGAFALAETRFRKAVEKSPRDLTAWIGLAATYDRLRRFDLADRAYGQAIKIGGVTVTILNNRGYSYLLRGDVVNARKQFMEAYKIDPNNPTVINNLHLLDGSKQYVRRVDTAY